MDELAVARHNIIAAEQNRADNWGSQSFRLDLDIDPLKRQMIPVTNNFYYFNADKIKSKPVKEATFSGRSN